MVDSSDQLRLEEARGELFSILESDEMRNVPVTVIANKQDLPASISPSQLIERLQLRMLTGHKWHVQGACAVTGTGVYESMEAMAKLVLEFKAQRR